MNFRRIGTNLLLSLALISIGFGFFKQIRTAARSVREMGVSHEEAGSDLRLLRNGLLETPDGESMVRSIAYSTDRRQEKGARPIGQFYFDAQYAFAPYALKKDSGDYELRDSAAGPAHVYSKKDGHLLV